MCSQLAAFAPALPIAQAVSRVSRSRAFSTAAMHASLDAPATSVAGVQPVFAQAMLRVSDAETSIAFYKEAGMRYLAHMHFPEYQFSLHFLAAPDPSLPPSPPADTARKDVAQWLWALRCPTLELTYNWPAPGKDAPEKYASGNEKPRGFGHLALAMPTLPRCATHLPHGATLPGETSAVVADPDGYAVKVVAGTSRPLFARTMLRVRDAAKSVRFFEHLGMQRVCQFDADGASHIFLAYINADTQLPPQGAPVDQCVAFLSKFSAPVVHLRHDWEHPEPKLVSGNEKPYRGFGHLGVIVDDIYAVMQRMEKLGYGVVRKPSPFLDVGDIAFVKDDDVGYWVELINRNGKPAENAYFNQ